MVVGVIGLGKMGSAIVFRLTKGGHQVIGFDPDVKARRHAATYGAHIVESLEHVAQQSRIIWLMLPAGELIDEVLKKLQPFLKPNDTIIDGGNSHFTDSLRRAKTLKKKKINYIDCGTSGGLAGKTKGFSLMLGGDRLTIQNLEPIFKAIAAPQGYDYMGPSGAGHYVKMVHNGIEYALLQSYAEGFDLLHNGTYKNLDLKKISKVWSHGSIIRSYILDLAHSIFNQDQTLESIGGEIHESGTGRWTVEEAYAQKIPLVLIQDALDIREWSRKTGGNYATKVVALLRHKFGGHAITKIKKRKTS